MWSQLREQVHTWKIKAEQRKVKTANLAKELTVTKQALDAATAQHASAYEAAEANEEDGRMWKLVAEQAQEEETRLRMELEWAGQRVADCELASEMAGQEKEEQRNAARQAAVDRDRMYRELTSVLEALARGEADEVRRRHAAGESFQQGQPSWLGGTEEGPPIGGTGPGSTSSRGSSFAWMEDPLGTGSGWAREEQQRRRDDRSTSPSLLSDDGAGSMTSRDSQLDVESALERSRARMAEERRATQEHTGGLARGAEEHMSRAQDWAEAGDGGEDMTLEEEVAFMAAAAAREVHAAARSGVSSKSKVDARQQRTPVASSVKSLEAQQAGAARRRNKRVRQKQKASRLSAAEGGFRVEGLR